MVHRHLRALARLFLAGALLAAVATVAHAAGGRTRYEYDASGNLTLVTDVSSDVNNCGAVGNVCAAGYACCQGVCANTTNNVMSCGACGNICPAPASNGVAWCSQSQCGFSCNAGYTFCAAANSCLALSSDVNNCGACGNVCVAPAGGYASCGGGSCRATCEASDVLCPGTGAGEVCVDLATNPAGCGACSGASCGGMECVVAPSSMIRVDATAAGDVGHELQDCSLVPALPWPPAPSCSGGVCW